jgi:hypothetical protein
VYARATSRLTHAGLAWLIGVGIGLNLAGCSTFSEAGGSDAEASDAPAGDALSLDGGSEACPRFCDDFERTQLLGPWERTNSGAAPGALALDPISPLSGALSLRVRAVAGATEQSAYLIKSLVAPGRFTWSALLRVNDAASVVRVNSVVTDMSPAHQVGLRIDRLALKLVVQYTTTRFVDVGPALVVGQSERVTVGVDLLSEPPRVSLTRGSGESFGSDMKEWSGTASETLTFRFGASYIGSGENADVSLDAFQLAY